MKGSVAWLNYLRDSGVRYSHSVHPWAETAMETADAERILAHEFAKCVVYFCETGFGMAVIPADQFVDVAGLARLLGATFLRLADEAEMAELFPNCELGAMPPFGNVYNMPVVVDREVAARKFIAFAIGSHRDVVRMAFADYDDIVRPLIGSIVAPVAAVA
jgi:Ala-tRNA(Pro) deacylase